MNRFTISHTQTGSSQQDRNNRDLLNGLNLLGAFLVEGDGAPAHSPDAPQLYVRRDGGVGSAIYAWDTASWTALA